MDTALVAREDEMVGRTPQTSSSCVCVCVRVLALCIWCTMIECVLLARAGACERGKCLAGWCTNVRACVGRSVGVGVYV